MIDEYVKVKGISGKLPATRIPATVWDEANLKQKIEIQIKMGIKKSDAIKTANSLKNEEYLGKMDHYTKSKLFTFTRNHCLDQRDKERNLDIDHVNSFQQLIFNMTGKLNANQTELVKTLDGREYWEFEKN